MDEQAIFREEAIQARRDRFRNKATMLPTFSGWRWLCIAGALLGVIGSLLAWAPVQSAVRIGVVAAYDGGQWKVQLDHSPNRGWIAAGAAEEVCGAVLNHRQITSTASAASRTAYLVVSQERSTLLRRLMDRSPAHAVVAPAVRCLEALE